MSSTQYYDIIININSLESLGKITLKNCDASGGDIVIEQEGWEILYNDKGKLIYEEKRNSPTIVLGVIGNSNRGKTFVLQQIAGEDLESGYSIQTKGISLKYPVSVQKSFVILDSAGFETPLLKKEELEFGDKTSERDRIEAYKKIAKDKLLTERFLQDFILHYSNTVIVVINLLTYQEQTLLKRIKKKCIEEKRALLVIHNLSTFVKVEQVKNYINNVLLKSLTFSLFSTEMNLTEEEDSKKKQEPNANEKSEDINYEYFREPSKNDEKHEVVHFIMAKEGSPAGKFYNKSTIDFIRSKIEVDVDRNKFDVLKEIKKYLIECSGKYMISKLKEESILIGEGEKEAPRKIRLANENEEIELKNCLLDEMGFEKLYDKIYKPNYCCFKTTEKNKAGENKNWFVVVIEIVGEIKDIKSRVEIIEEYYSFLITGVKIEESEEREGIKIEWSEKEMKSKDFCINFRKKINDLKLKELKVQKSKRTPGYLALYFETKDADSKPKAEPKTEE